MLGDICSERRIRDDRLFRERGGSYEGGIYRPKPWPQQEHAERVILTGRPAVAAGEQEAAAIDESSVW